MATSSQTPRDRFFRFGPFELSEREGELRKNGVRIKLQEQPFRVLLELVANASRVVTREELHQKLWQVDTFVDFNVGLNTAIRKLRQALGDDADEPRYIETLAKRGYSFVAPVAEIAATAAPVSTGNPPTVIVENIRPINGSLGDTGGQRSPDAGSNSNRAAVRKKQTRYWGVAVACALALVIYGTLAYAPRLWKPRLAVEQRITANPPEAPTTAATISPDGKYVAYSDTTGVYIRHIDSGETRPLQLPKGFDAAPTGWFSDSIHLLLSLREIPGRPSSIWKISILGGNPQAFIENASEGVVSPDGSRIAFLRVDSSNVPEIWISGSDGSNPQRLVKVPGPKDSGSGSALSGVQQYAGASISRPAWSPDGSRVAYIRGLWVGAFRLGEKSYYALESVDARGGPPKLLRSSPELLPTLTWAADGRLLYAENDDKTSERVDYGVWSIRVHPRSGEAKEKPVQLTTGSGRIGSLSTSADGKRLVVGRSNTQPEVYLAEVDRKTRQLGTPHRLTLDQNGNIVSAWTPDSRAILFYSNRNGTWTLFRQAIDQVVPDVLVGGRTMFLPRLNPDGTQILYLTGYKPDDPARPVQVMKVPIQGGSPQVLLQKTSLANAQCARRPSKLCLLDTFAGGSQEFFSFDSDSGETREFVKFSTTEFINWSLSPDGTQLAFLLSPKIPKISFMAVRGKSTHELEIKGAAGLGSIDWAGDGKSVFTSGTASNGIPAVWNAEPGGNNRLVLEGDKHTAYWWVIPSPDGRYLALEQITGENNVWMVENF